MSTNLTTDSINKFTNGFEVSFQNIGSTLKTNIEHLSNHMMGNKLGQELASQFKEFSQSFNIGSENDLKRENNDLSQTQSISNSKLQVNKSNFDTLFNPSSFEIDKKDFENPTKSIKLNC